MTPKIRPWAIQKHTHSSMEINEAIRLLEKELNLADTVNRQILSAR